MRIMACVLLAACLSIGGAHAGDEQAGAHQLDQNRSIVDVVALHEHAENRHLFRISSHEIPAGWTTFRFTNASPVDHFFLIWRYPAEGIAAAEAAGQSLLDHWRDRVAMSFDGFDAYLAGEVGLEEYTEGLVASLQANAPWFLDPGAAPHGGPGFSAPGVTTATTVLLEPGEYIVECYVRDEHGVFHTAAGMLDHIIVHEERQDAPEPVATARIVISSAEGIVVETPPLQGENIVEVHFEDQLIYPHFLGHNVQLARLPNAADVDTLNALAMWMDWRNPQGLVNRAPGGVRFLGGVMEMTGGSTAYLHVALEPGDYAWIAEAPEPAARNMLQTFTLQ